MSIDVAALERVFAGWPSGLVDALGLAIIGVFILWVLGVLPVRRNA